jgi:hypothetical protein
MSERAPFIPVGKTRCVATGRPVAQDHAKGPHGNLVDFPGGPYRPHCRLIVDQPVDVPLVLTRLTRLRRLKDTAAVTSVGTSLTRAMSDLSLQSGPKRTLITSLALEFPVGVIPRRPHCCGQSCSGAGFTSVFENRYGKQGLRPWSIRRGSRARASPVAA